MVLNYIWVALFLIGFVVSIGRFIFPPVANLFGFEAGEIDYNVFPTIVQGTFIESKRGFEFALGLTATLTLWLGLMKVGEKSGIIDKVAHLIKPFFKRIFPSIPSEHAVNGHIFMNFSANLLGLDNAATPIGLKAMQGMQELNPDKERASDAQIMFLTLNASGLTLIPVSIMAARAAAHAPDPSDVFIPILIATFFSTIAGLLAVSIYQRINLLNKVVLLTLFGISLFIAGILFLFSYIRNNFPEPDKKIELISSVGSNFILFLVIIFFISYGFYKKINVYDAFIEGAKEGFGTAIKIIPYIIAILVAVGIFRDSGAMSYLMNGLTSLLTTIGLNADFVPALPTAIMKPLSGSGARGMMVSTMETYGVISFPGKLACVFQGAADTTFYILTVYFGYVGVKNSRYALKTCLIADVAGAIAAIWVAYIFFH
jgi:spore maturation protein SpmA